MKGKHLAIGFLVALFGVVGLVFWFGATGQHDANREHAPASPVGKAPAEPTSATGHDGGTNER